jgi:hypothetical protein
VSTSKETQENAVRNRLVALFSIILALLVVLICIVDIFIIRRRMAVPRATEPTELQIAPPATAAPKTIPTMAPPEQLIPVVENTATPEPAIITVPPITTWRFLRINADDIGTFENVANPNQTLVAKCIDPGRPPPNKGALYTLDDSGTLKLQDGSKKYQRFRVTSGQ